MIRIYFMVNGKECFTLVEKPVKKFMGFKVVHWEYVSIKN